MKFRLNPRSIARLLPAVAVALLPFGLLDAALLKAKYALRGPLPLPASQQIVVARSATELYRLGVLAEKMPGIDHCVMISSSLPDDHPCAGLSVGNLYRLADFETALKHRAFFYGPLKSFPTLDGEALLIRANRPSPDTKTLVLVDSSAEPKVPIDTPLGQLLPVEVAANLALSQINGVQPQTAPPGVRQALALGMMLVAAAIVYTYPTLLAMIFVFVLGATEFAFAFMLFENSAYELPVFASWAAMLAVVILGMSDRLDRRERREWEIEHTAENLKSLDEMRNNFLSLVSHDLKTPIAKILSMLDRLNRGEFGTISPQQHLALDRIVSTSGYLQRTISTLLLLGRIETKDFQIRRQPTDLTHLLHTAAEQHRNAALDRGLRVELEIEPLFLVDLDPDLIAQVVNNLIDNAMKYSPAGSRVIVRCGESENCVELSPPQPGVWFEVQDEGPGIPAADRGRVLEKFVRGANESTAADQSVKGTGLGLYLSRFFVEKHGGRLSLVSKTVDEDLRPGSSNAAYFSRGQSGTVIRIVLPLEAPPIEVG